MRKAFGISDDPEQCKMAMLGVESLFAENVPHFFYALLKPESERVLKHPGAGQTKLVDRPFSERRSTLAIPLGVWQLSVHD